MDFIYVSTKNAGIFCDYGVTKDGRVVEILSGKTLIKHLTENELKRIASGRWAGRGWREANPSLENE